MGNNNGIVTGAGLTGTNDPNADPEMDGFTNKQEADAVPVASNPNLAASVPGDSDEDKLADQWELDFFGDISTQNGFHESDDDTNEEEEKAGTDPTDPEDFDARNLLLTGGP